MTTRVPRRMVAHVHKGQPYYLEDSMRGVLWFIVRLAFPWIDLDCNVTKDGVLIICHGPHPLAKGVLGGYTDPLGLISPNATYEELTWAEVSRLRTPDGYKVRRADFLVPFVLAKGGKVELEVKSRAITEAQLAALRKILDRPERVQVKGFPKFLPALNAAHAAGFLTIVLCHTRRVALPRAAQRFLTFYRTHRPRFV